jgi:uncharacterized protein
VNFEGSILLDSPPDTVWQLLDDPEAVSRCIPGLAGFQAVDDDTFSAQVSQTVGPVTAIFAMKVSVVEREPGKAIRFKALGRTTKGAVSHLRANGSVQLAEETGGTRVTLAADAALGGVLGTVGEKVLVKQGEKVTAQFGAALQRELGPDQGEPTVPGRAGAAGQTTTPEPALPVVGSGLVIQWPRVPAAALLAGLVAGFALGRLSKRAS